MNTLSRAEAFAAAEPLVAAGVAPIWLRPAAKKPRTDNWTELPPHTLTSLRADYRDGANIGIRCGAPSKTPGGYVHVVDLDVLSPEHAAEAHGALDALLPEWRTMPMAISGSGGASRHIYVLADQPLRSRKLAQSPGFEMVWSQEKGRDVKKRHWEVDLKGTGNQVVLPPSIHPETGRPYSWERPLDATDLLLGLLPTTDASLLGDAVAVETEFEDDDAELMAIVRTKPLGLDEDEIVRTLRDLPEDWVEDRDSWYQVGMALHHEYGGADAGRERWFEWSKQSAKFDPRDAARVWKSFKQRTLKPVRMATLIQAAGEARVSRAVAEFEAGDESEGDYYDDLLGPPATIEETDDLLGPIGKPEAPDPGVNPDRNWTSCLAMTEEGEIKACLHNVELIVSNDARLFGRLGVNLLLQAKVFVQEPARLRKKARDGKPVRQLTGPIWSLDEPGHAIDGKRWTDDHESALRSIVEAPAGQGGYSLKVSDRDLRAAVANVANQHVFHPIRDRLRSIAWDGRPRAETLFIDYLGCPDDPYHREAARLTLLGAVTRAFNPGHKFDFVPILEGGQGVKKSTFVRVLGLHWAAELAVDFHDNNRVIEAMQDAWVMEIPELQGFSKADTTLLKAVISRTHDKGRLAWERNVREFPRQCIFVGTTNDEDYLRDTTGGRRYWPIVVRVAQIDTNRLRLEIDQVWAEALVWHDAMRVETPRGDLPLYLTDPRAVAIAEQLQESRRTEVPEEILAAEIRRVLDEPMTTDLDGATEPRDVTCAKEVWVDLLGRDPRECDSQLTTRLLGKAMRMAGWRQAGTMRHHKYGITRAWRRK